MAYKFIYLTVQHSGTRFLENYFLHLGFSPLQFTRECSVCGIINFDYTHEHVPDHNKSGKVEYTWHHYTGLGNNTKDTNGTNRIMPVVSTLRHPYDTAISYISRGYDLRTCLNGWERLIRTSTKVPITYCYVDCKEENRKAQLLNVVRQIDCYDENTEERTNEFVLDWKPVGVYNSTYKTEYLLNGKLPDVFDWSRFDRAVNWFNKRMEECEY